MTPREFHEAVEARVNFPIIVEDLTVNAGRETVLDQVDFTIQPGETVEITGPTGAGKTTLAEYIIGLAGNGSNGSLPRFIGRTSLGRRIFGQDDVDHTHISGGDVFWGDMSIYDLNEEQRADLRGRFIGFVPQRSNLLPEISVAENIQLIGKLLDRPVSDDRVEEVAGVAGISKKLHSKAGSLSGGEQQRAAIARALSQDPQVLVFDEPTSGLDKETTVKTYDRLRKLVDDTGKTGVMINHERAWADREVKLEDGQVVKIQRFGVTEEFHRIVGPLRKEKRR